MDLGLADWLCRLLKCAVTSGWLRRSLICPPARWFAKTRQQPVYPFGHGLSYTSLAHNDLKVTGDDTINVADRRSQCLTRS